MLQKLKYTGLIIASALLVLAGCKKWLPEDLDYLSPQAVYTQTEFYPVLGRTTVYSRIFSTDNSNTPIHFEITNVRYKATGKPTNDLEKEVSTWVWKKAYTGNEKSVAEINAKRVKEKRPVWQVRETSGDFILWAGSDSTMLRTQPDSGYLFDVVASNSGSTRTYKDLILDPWFIQPYEPYDKDPYTGGPLYKANINDQSHLRPYHPHPLVINVIGDQTDEPVESDSVNVYFYKTGDGNTLTFKFLDNDSTLINPAMFNRTVWDSLVHGFNVKITDTSVSYDVAYPIPVVNYPTRFTTSNGAEAQVRFTYDRIGYGGRRQTAAIVFAFAIYQKGDWEVVFHFHGDNPKFRDE